MKEPQPTFAWLQCARIAACLILGLLILPSTASAQFLRIGRMDFVGKVGAEWVYSSNVEQERESESTLPRKDNYYVASLTISSDTDVNRDSDMQLDSMLRVERHQKRKDLNEEAEPFGHTRLAYLTDRPPWTLRAEANYVREWASVQDTYKPEGAKKRDPYTQWSYQVQPSYLYKNVSFSAGYSEMRERHDEEQFQDGDVDQSVFSFAARQVLAERLETYQTYQDDQSDFLHPKEHEYRKTTVIGADYLAIQKPDIRLGVGVEREETQVYTNPKWDPFYRVAITDTRELWPTLKLQYSAMYTKERTSEDDDVGFVYGVTLVHEISYSMIETLSASRAPRATFGSNNDTDTTRYSYRLDKKDLFIRSLTASAMYMYEINKPIETPEEDVTSYSVSLTHSAKISRDFERQFSYLYYHEESSLYKNDPIVEQRFTVGISYNL